LKDISHTKDEEFADCVTTLGKFHEFLHGVCAIWSDLRLICIRLGFVCTIRCFKYETSVKVVSKEMNHNIAAQ